MPYAHNGKISQDPIEGGVEITDEQYQQALAGILAGLEVSIIDGFKLTPKPGIEAPQTPGLPVVPLEVSMRQGREALIRRGKFDLVDSAIASMTGVEGRIARNEWERSQVIQRHRPLTAQMFALIGVNDEASRDEWFTYASTL